MTRSTDDGRAVADSVTARGVAFADGSAAKSPRCATPHVPGEPGLWILIFGDLCVFTILFCVQIYYRVREPQVFYQAQNSVNRGLGGLNTVLLLVSSLFVILVVRTARTERRASAAAPSIAGALGCGALFIVVKIVEYNEMISAGITPATNTFFTYYFILTGLHLFHLIGGMFFLASLFAMVCRRPSLSDRQFSYLEGGGCYWHMVDLLWIVLFALVYLMR